MKRYLRIQDGDFYFILEGMTEVFDSDILLGDEELVKYFELQSLGKEFRVKSIPTGKDLFGIIEEYVPDIPKLPPAPPSETELLKEEALNQSEIMLEMDFRMTNLELGL